jgi:hypothetical protein
MQMTLWYEYVDKRSIDEGRTYLSGKQMHFHVEEGLITRQLGKTVNQKDLDCYSFYLTVLAGACSLGCAAHANLNEACIAAAGIRRNSEAEKTHEL